MGSSRQSLLVIARPPRVQVLHGEGEAVVKKDTRIVIKAQSEAINLNAHLHRCLHDPCKVCIAFDEMFSIPMRSVMERKESK